MTKENYIKILNDNNIIIPKCVYCNDIIYFKDSKITIKRDKTINIVGKSHLTFKKGFNNIYNIKSCETCIKNNVIESNTTNYNKWFNTWNKISQYAFNINNDDFIKLKSINAITLENLTKKYGNLVGKEKFESYKNKQAYSNSLEYKEKKYGWNENEFKNYNKSRAVTLDNLIKKHGELEGIKNWQKYIARQQETKSKEYFILKYGETEWNSLCKSKGHNIENYLLRYKNLDLAIEKLDIFLKKNLLNTKSVSKSSQKYLTMLYEKLKDYNYNIFFFEKDKKEYMKYLNGSLVYLDFYIKELNICIEYNGDLYHANPKIFNADDEPIPFNNIKAKTIWEKDKNRILGLEKQYNIKTIVVWESELPEIDKLIETILNKK